MNHNSVSDIKDSVLQRYSEGAKERQEALCCPVDYDASLLSLLPQAIIDRDYGCGDPSRYVLSGDTVLDLGSGGGKICYMAAQLTGEKGFVIGIDMNDDMLALARNHQQDMAGKLGNDRVDFRKGYIQDLALNVSALESYIEKNPVSSLEGIEQLELWKDKQRLNDPLVASASVDIVVSNCVLNLVAETHRTQMISEIFRVLKPGGRVAISDIVVDEHVPQSLKDDAQLWSGCISGAFQEKDFLQVFLDAGFVAVAYDKWDNEPWQVVDGFEFRSVTITAIKPEETQNTDAGQALIYKGPFREVLDDMGNNYPRGERIAVSKNTFSTLTSTSFGDQFIGIQPASTEENPSFCIAPGTRRPACETKGGRHGSQNEGSGCC